MMDHKYLKYGEKVLVLHALDIGFIVRDILQDYKGEEYIDDIAFKHLIKRGN